MFSTHHNVSNSFAGDRSVSLKEFTDYHHFISSFIEADKMFKLFMSGVWNMDVVDFSNQNGGNVGYQGGVTTVSPAGVLNQ
jgi:hypothetical protein